MSLKREVKMSKDSYWFKHDANAGRGLRMMQMQHIYGHWGKGVYWDVIEVLRDQSEYRFKSDDSSLGLLSSLVMVLDKNRFLSWFRDCVRIELFEIEGEYFYSEKLRENMKKWETLKANGCKGGRPPKTKEKPKPKPNNNQTPNLNGTIIGDKSIEEKNKELYQSFLLLFKEKLSKNFRSKKEFPNFLARLSDGFEMSDFEKAIESMKNDSYHKETKHKHITPEFVCRIDKLEKFLNITTEKPKEQKQSPYSANQIFGTE